MSDSEDQIRMSLLSRGIRLSNRTCIAQGLERVDAALTKKLALRESEEEDAISASIGTSSVFEWFVQTRIVRESVNDLETLQINTGALFLQKS